MSTQEQHFIYVIHVNICNEAHHSISAHKTRDTAIKFAEKYMREELFEDYFEDDIITTDSIKISDKDIITAWFFVDITITISRIELRE